MQSVWEELSKEISEHVARAGRSVVAVDGRGGHTSAGIVWRPDLVLTAAHSIRADSNIGIIWESGKPVRARLAGRLSGAGIALPDAEPTHGAELLAGALAFAVAYWRKDLLVAMIVGVIAVALLRAGGL